jgi:hypothetical protein
LLVALSSAANPGAYTPGAQFCYHPQNERRKQEPDAGALKHFMADTR